jgi:hypothetical protein
VKAPLLYEPQLFHPVLDTFVHALPVAYAGVSAADNTHVVIDIAGEAGGSWSVVRSGGQWELFEDVGSEPVALIRLDQDTAWRLWTKGIGPETARARVEFEGDKALCEPVLHAISIIA